MIKTDVPCRFGSTCPTRAVELFLLYVANIGGVFDRGYSVRKVSWFDLVAYIYIYIYIYIYMYIYIT